jgi:hypothetical protein
MLVEASFTYKGRSVGVRAVGRKLGVRSFDAAANAAGGAGRSLRAAIAVLQS